MKIACLPDPVSSAHTTHGTVAVPGVSVPEATLGSSASRAGFAFSEHPSSALTDAAQGRRRGGAGGVSSVFVSPPAPLPTACQWNPPSAAGSATSLAANTCSLLRRPRALGPVAQHTTQE